MAAVKAPHVSASKLQSHQVPIAVGSGTTCDAHCPAAPQARAEVGGGEAKVAGLAAIAQCGVDASSVEMPSAERQAVQVLVAAQHPRHRRRCGHRGALRCDREHQFQRVVVRGARARCAAVTAPAPGAGTAKRKDAARRTAVTAYATVRTRRRQARVDLLQSVAKRDTCSDATGEARSRAARGWGHSIAGAAQRHAERPAGYQRRHVVRCPCGGRAGGV